MVCVRDGKASVRCRKACDVEHGLRGGELQGETLSTIRVVVDSRGQDRAGSKPNPGHLKETAFEN